MVKAAPEGKAGPNPLSKPTPEAKATPEPEPGLDPGPDLWGDTCCCTCCAGVAVSYSVNKINALLPDQWLCFSKSVQYKCFFANNPKRCL